jgi:GNAT superfamily N-acetyltransferase
VTRTFDLRLDVATAEVEPFQSVRQRVKDSGITITSFAEERTRDSRCVEKLFELSCLLNEDDPGRGPLKPPSYDAREALLWLQMPYVLPDAYFIARKGDLYLGISDLNLLEALPRGLNQGFTGVRREYRRQGIASALKLQAIEYARQHDYKIIRCCNLPIQTPVLALNQKLGFQLSSSNVTLEKCLRDVVAVDSSVYDKYTGQYRDDRQPDLEMIVRNEGGRLTIEAAGQKVELFPISERQFFVKQFYGEATFYTNEQGRADELKFVMPEYKTRKATIQHAKRITSL